MRVLSMCSQQKYMFNHGGTWYYVATGRPEGRKVERQKRKVIQKVSIVSVTREQNQQTAKRYDPLK